VSLFRTTTGTTFAPVGHASHVRFGTLSSELAWFNYRPCRGDSWSLAGYDSHAAGGMKGLSPSSGKRASSHNSSSSTRPTCMGLTLTLNAPARTRLSLTGLIIWESKSDSRSRKAPRPAASYGLVPWPPLPTCTVPASARLLPLGPPADGSSARSSWYADM
jgi:hypothetical protein